MAGYFDYLYGQIVEWAEREGVEDIEVEQFSDYAIANRLPLRPPITFKQQTMRDVARALQKKTYIDPQGNEVRTKHAVRVPQMNLPNMPPRVEYVDSRTGKPDKMEMSMDQFYELIESTVKRHAVTTNSYNLNNPWEAKLKDYNYDFSVIAEDARMSGNYRDEIDPDEFDDLD
ncbi:MAG TPA: hypothetical protein VNO50_16250 [Pyrinomonadaceae bacterium]|nr:hypothetical protein [Pyrinomonadaceae bacterium]